MAKAWVVYESMFGNTRLLATAVAEELGTSMEVELHEVSHSGQLPPDLDLLVVGAPTHAFGLSRPSTRDDAAQKSGRPVESATMGVREWLEALVPAQHGPSFATFDTRVDHPRVPGSAAKKAAKRLRRLGWREATAPATFWVEGVQGPVDEDEIFRSRRWARQLAATAAGPGTVQPVH